MVYSDVARHVESSEGIGDEWKQACVVILEKAHNLFICLFNIDDGLRPEPGWERKGVYVDAGDVVTLVLWDELESQVQKNGVWFFELDWEDYVGKGFEYFFQQWDASVFIRLKGVILSFRGRNLQGVSVL